MDHEIIHNVGIAPYQYGTMPMVGGAWSDWKDILRHKRSHCIESQPPNFRELDFVKMRGRHFFGGPLFLHFGHFIMESLSRVWAFAEAQRSGLLSDESKIIYNIFHGDKLTAVECLPNYILEILSIIEIDISRIHIVQEPTMVDELVAVEQGCGLYCNISDGFRNFIAKTREKNYSVSHERKANGRLLYISRQAYRSRGNYLGESLIESTLAQNGFEIIYPEQYTVKHQIEMFESARGIVFSESSALHLLVLCPSFFGSVVVIKRRGHEPFTKQLSELQIDFSSIEPEVILPKIYPVGSRILSYCSLDSVVDLVNHKFGTGIRKLCPAMISDIISTELCWHAMKSVSQDPALFLSNLSDLLSAVRSIPVETREAEKLIFQFSKRVTA